MHSRTSDTPLRTPRSFLVVFLLFFLFGLLRVPAAQDIVLADFESDTYGDWTATGDAFGPGPAHGTLPGQMDVSGFLGHGLVNSFYQGDKTTGTLTSPEFTINRRYLTFLIGGGGFSNETCLNLLVDGQTVRTATGPNTKPGGSEHLDATSWDINALAGQTARLRIVDRATGGWGHINVDQIVLTDRQPPSWFVNPERQLTVSKRYLNLPVKTGAPKHHVRLLVGGRIMREFEIELADADPDFWVFLDLRPFQGQSATLQVDKLRDDTRALDLINQSDSLTGAENLYHERYRPQFHFSSRRGWNNDPNGLVFYRGEYHLFYQHNPYGWDWGNMHWGHAVSSDLVHWQELPIAIYPRQFGDWAFSGSAVVDDQNTSGFKSGPESPLVAAFTSTGRGECIAYSNDRGRTWTEYSGNPVVTHQGRDPRLLWFAPKSEWIMAVYDETNKTRNISFYSSPDLKHWKYESRIDGFFECPDLFELPVEGEPGATKWILTAASSEYRIGAFDGHAFTPETPQLPGHRGNGFYAAQTFSNVPADDAAAHETMSRRIQIGWGRMPAPGMSFNQMMCFPCRLTLRRTSDGLRMCFQPVKELQKLHGEMHHVDPRALRPGETALSGVHGELFDLRAEIEAGDAKEIAFDIRGVPVVYDVDQQTLSCLDRTAPLAKVNGRIRLQFLVDRTSLEIFGNDGLLYMPMAVLPKQTDQSLRLSCKGGTAQIVSLEADELKSIWP